MQQLLHKKQSEENTRLKNLVGVLPNSGTKDLSFRLFANMDTDRIL